MRTDGGSPPADTEAIAGLLGELGHPTTREPWPARFARLSREPAVSLVVADADRRAVGLAGLRVVNLVERDAGRPARRARGRRGVPQRGRRPGARRARRGPRAPAGCVRLDLGSSDRRDGAHAFYRRHGFADISRRFVKDLAPRER